MAMGPNTLLMTSPEAAEALSISQRPLWGLTQRGDIPCVRIGRAVRYDPADLRTWIDAQKDRSLKKTDNA